jgi:O-antigen/teichoic acid export membrane protein
MKDKLKSVFILSVATFITGLISYFYHPLMIRFLDLKEFAEFESVL